MATARRSVPPRSDTATTRSRAASGSATRTSHSTRFVVGDHVGPPRRPGERALVAAGEVAELDLARVHDQLGAVELERNAHGLGDLALDRDVGEVRRQVAVVGHRARTR
jgi:hypothetical protein